ncbi:MAG TPA: TIGR03085 family metal-binding protein [Streptosporangiaceae bacterium]|jgi:uncharacterized protein (TIGR03085 family)|nr:TIGR03085 family metal-binding protein [Streptosporangiaceae bacterium]
MGYSRDERLALCATLDQVGPDAPTLCAGWTARDLAAHLVLRERRVVAAAGIPGGPLAGYTARVQERLARGKPFTELVETIRTGPPRLSPYGLPGLDERVNTVEFFVHHEDVRRGQPEWKPRNLPGGFSDELWNRLKLARFLLRKVRVGVEYAREDGSAVNKGASDGGAGNGTPSYRMPVHRGTPVVTVIGTPAELTLYSAGRRSAAQIRMDGTGTAIGMLSEANWRL